MRDAPEPDTDFAGTQDGFERLVQNDFDCGAGLKDKILAASQQHGSRAHGSATRSASVAPSSGGGGFSGGGGSFGGGAGGGAGGGGGGSW